MSRYVPPHLRSRERAQLETERRVEKETSVERGARTAVVPKKSLPPSEDDFPSLAKSDGEKGKGGGAWGSEKRFADLARSWGAQQKEEEEERKRLMKQKVTEDMMRREQEEKDRAFYRIGLAKASQLIYKENRDDEEAELYDLGGAKPVEKDMVTTDDFDMYVPPEEEETCSNWNAPRKNRYDLY